MPNKTDLPRVAWAVARALRPGGFFYFDVNNRAGFQAYWKGAVRVEKQDFVLLLSNGNDARHDRAWCDCDWFLREGRLWRRYQERVEEVCWTQREIRRALRHGGFDTIRAFDSAPFFKGNPLIMPGCRTHYLARKSV